MKKIEVHTHSEDEKKVWNTPLLKEIGLIRETTKTNTLNQYTDGGDTNGAYAWTS